MSDQVGNQNVGFLTTRLIYSFSHYNNTPIQYTVNFNGCKNDNFKMQKMLYSEAVLTSTHNLCFRAKMRKMYTLVNPSFIIEKSVLRGVLIF